MEVSKILALAKRYAMELSKNGVKPARMVHHRTFAECNQSELLSHACYLAEAMLALDPIEQYGKLNRHLTAVQMLLSFGGIYTLGQLMIHNRPD